MFVRKTFGKMQLKKRTLPEWLTLYIFIFPFVTSTLLELFKLPSFVKYTADIAWVAAFVLVFFKKKLFLKKKIMPLVSIMLAWLVFTATVYCFNYQSPFYFLWGFRNNFRFFAAFLVYAMLLDEGDANNCFKFMDVIFWINAVITFFQFFVLGYKYDFLGGIFGVQQGSNAYTIIFFSVVLAKSLISYMEHKESAKSCFSKCGIAMIISAMAELKVFLLIFVGLLVMSAFLTKFSWKKVILFVVASFCLFVAVYVFYMVYENKLTVSKIISLIKATNYSSTDDLGRGNAISFLSENILTTMPERLFGLGLGNCDTSAFAICNTPFYENYSYLHYSWFSSAFTFLETGYIGMGLSLSFFLICFILSYKSFKKKEGNVFFCKISILISVICIGLFFYNSSLRFETAYLAYFVLALPFVSKNKTTH